MARSDERHGATVAQLAYEAYGDVVGWSSFAGDPISGWDSMDDLRKDAWHAAVSRIIVTRSAREGYEAYGDATGWLNYGGTPMPGWEHLTDKIRDGWHAVATLVTGAVP